MPELSPDWTSPSFLVQAWYVCLLVAGLLSLIYLAAHRSRWAGLPPPGVREWRIGWVDMGILLCMLFVWSLMAGSLTARLLPLEEGEASPALEIWRTVLNGGMLQVGMALIFLGFWLSQPFEHRLSFNSEQRDWGSALRLALLYLLAFMPVRYLLELLWMAVLTQLEALGFSPPMEPQGITNYFSADSPPLALVAMLLLAAVLAPMVEELVLRAGLYPFLKGRLGRGAAMIASAALFSMLHGNVLAAPTLMLLGVTLCLAYEAGGNIKVPMLMHALFNLNSSLLLLLQSRM